MHTLRILEKKDRAIPVIVRYEDEAGGKREASTTIIIGTQLTPTPTRAPVNVAPAYTEKETPGFTGLLVQIGLAAAAVMVRRR